MTGQKNICKFRENGIVPVSSAYTQLLCFSIAEYSGW